MFDLLMQSLRQTPNDAELAWRWELLGHLSGKLSAGQKQDLWETVDRQISNALDFEARSDITSAIGHLPTPRDLISVARILRHVNVDAAIEAALLRHVARFVDNDAGAASILAVLAERVLQVPGFAGMNF